MSDHLDAVRDECANGRLSPNVAGALDELEARVRQLEDVAENASVAAPDTTGGGE